MDGEGNYYHVAKGKGKRYIACNAPKAGEADFASVVEGLRKEAGRRAESVQRERQQNEEHGNPVSSSRNHKNKDCLCANHA